MRMEEVLNNAYGATIEKAAVIAAMNLSEELSRTEAALNQAREEANALRTKTKEFAGADGLKARLSEAEMKLGVLQEKLRLAENRAEAAEKEAEKAKAAAQNAAHTAAAEPLDLPPIDLRNPMLPDYGDETGLVSFFEKADVKETAREDEED